MPRELENLNSAYGSEHDLRQCIGAFHDAGVKVLADIVVNHRCECTCLPPGLCLLESSPYAAVHIFGQWRASH